MFNSFLKSLGGSDTGATNASDDHASNRNTVQGDSGSAMMGGTRRHAAGASASGGGHRQILPSAYGVGGGGGEMAAHVHGVGAGGADGSFARSETGGEDEDFLVQFPEYGTNDVTSVASYGDDDDGYGAAASHYGSGDGMTAAGEVADDSTHGGAATAATATMLSKS